MAENVLLVSRRLILPNISSSLIVYLGLVLLGSGDSFVKRWCAHYVGCCCLFVVFLALQPSVVVFLQPGSGL